MPASSAGGFQKSSGGWEILGEWWRLTAKPRPARTKAAVTASASASLVAVIWIEDVAVTLHRHFPFHSQQGGFTAWERNKATKTTLTGSIMRFKTINVAAGRTIGISPPPPPVTFYLDANTSRLIVISASSPRAAPFHFSTLMLDLWPDDARPRL
ncbi:hypothetical protein Taro_042737 [Colocasia esculenta]|uniref:Uncharacterized protein n=1 Tax=Colocasia esculenta TaxID=4460 RepID=A0A843WTN8_COLES|nr:hypothetical protein [Colocasia esculenta]